MINTKPKTKRRTFEVKHKRQNNKRFRPDREINKGKILKEVINNPLQTQRQLSKSTGLGLGSINRGLKAVEQNGTKDERIIAICDKDLDNVTLGQKILNERMTKTPDKVRASDIIQMMAEGTRRYSLFRGNATDNKGGLNMASILDELLDGG